MKDLHSHYLYDLDDGANNIDESVKLIKKAVENGFTDIVLTPHYISNSNYNKDNKIKKANFTKLKKRLKEERIDVKLYLGNEVYISDNIINLIKDKKIYTLNNTKYILIELPINNILYEAKEIIYDLIRNGYVPILAHPERYKIVQDNKSYVTSFINMGVLLQINYKSLYGVYGRKAKKCVKRLLKNNWVTFIGSDTHHSEKFYTKNLKKKLLKYLKSEDKVNDILFNNFDKVMNDEDFNISRV